MIGLGSSVGRVRLFASRFASCCVSIVVLSCHLSHLAWRISSMTHTAVVQCQAMTLAVMLFLLSESSVISSHDVPLQCLLRVAPPIIALCWESIHNPHPTTTTQRLPLTSAMVNTVKPPPKKRLSRLLISLRSLILFLQPPTVIVAAPSNSLTASQVAQFDVPKLVFNFCQHSFSFISMS